MKNKLKSISILAALAFLLASCNSYEKLTYLQDIEITKDSSIFEKHKPGYQIQAGDLLYVQIITENEEINQLFNPMMSQTSSQNLRAESMFYTSYLVNDSGYIEMPLLEKMQIV